MNIRMLQSCWNVLSKRTDDWAEIRMAIEDQLTVQRNWNLHSNNSNPDMTRLKDEYKSRKESSLGKTGQIQMEINTVSKPITLVDEYEDTLNQLGNCYSCNKPGHLKRDCAEKTSTQPQAWSSFNRRQKKEVICFNCDKTGNFARQCRGPKKNYK